jgi:hypothetical protein
MGEIFPVNTVAPLTVGNRYLGQATNGCYICAGGGADTTHTMSMSRTPIFVREDTNLVRIGIPNWYVDIAHQTGLELGGGGVATVTASIEYPAGVFKQLLFSGSPTGHIPDGQTLFSDLAYLPIPKGALAWIRIFKVMENGGHIVYCAAENMNNSVNGRGWEFGSSGVTDKTMGGSVGNTAGTYNWAPPCAFHTYMKGPSIWGHGDSRTIGVGDTFDATGDSGQFFRSIRKLPYTNGGIAGDRAAWNVQSYARRLELAVPYHSHMIFGMGINDIVAANATQQQVLDAIAGCVAMYPASMDKSFCTMDPCTTSTDGHTTIDNQTKITNEAPRIAINNLARAGNLPGFARCFEIADSIEAVSDAIGLQRDGGKYYAHGGVAYAYDTIHRNPAGYQLQVAANAIDESLFVRAA